jgi:hypothetical protein
MTLGPLRTNYRIWRVAAGSVFVVLSVVDQLMGTTLKADDSLFAHVVILVRGEYSRRTVDLLLPLVFYALLLAVPALVVGWMFQAVVGILWSVAHREAPEWAGVPGHQGITAEPRAAEDRLTVLPRTITPDHQGLTVEGGLEDRLTVLPRTITLSPAVVPSSSAGEDLASIGRRLSVIGPALLLGAAWAGLYALTGLPEGWEWSARLEAWVSMLTGPIFILVLSGKAALSPMGVPICLGWLGLPALAAHPLRPLLGTGVVTALGTFFWFASGILTMIMCVWGA